MYATWISYSILTDMGSNPEVLSYKIPSWSSVSGVDNRADYSLTSSPYSLGKKQWISGYGADTNGIGASDSKSSGGARPVLNHGRIVMKRW